MSRLDRMTSWVRLSRARPKKAFQSPAAYQRGTRPPTRICGLPAPARRDAGPARAPAPPAPRTRPCCPGAARPPGRQTRTARRPARAGAARRGAGSGRSSGPRARPPCRAQPRPAGSRAWRERPRSSPASAPLPRSHRRRMPLSAPSLHSGSTMYPLASPSAAARLTLVEAAGDTLLAAFLVDERGLAEFAAEVPDLPPLHVRLLRRGLCLPHVLAQRARECFGQREDLCGAEGGGLAFADAGQLADDLLHPP